MTRIVEVAVLAMIACASARPILPFSQVAQVRGGGSADATAWEARLLDGVRRQVYTIGLVPLHAVEGGVVGFELVLLREGDSERNLLGERAGFDDRCKCYPETPSTVNIGYVKTGKLHSQFGLVRRFPLPRRGGVLTWEILDFQTGNGVGSCAACLRFESLRSRVSVGAAPSERRRTTR